MLFISSIVSSTVNSCASGDFFSQLAWLSFSAKNAITIRKRLSEDESDNILTIIYHLIITCPVAHRTQLKTTTKKVSLNTTLLMAVMIPD